MNIQGVDLTRLGIAYQEAIQNMAEAFRSLPTMQQIANAFYTPAITDKWKGITRQLLTLTQREARTLTRTAKIYGYRNARVIWVERMEQFVFLNFGPDDQTTEDIPRMGGNYQDALAWLRAEARGDHD